MSLMMCSILIPFFSGNWEDKYVQILSIKESGICLGNPVIYLKNIVQSAMCFKGIQLPMK